MKHIARVDVVSRDRVRRIVLVGVGTLAGARTRARNVERSEGAVCSAHDGEF